MEAGLRDKLLYHPAGSSSRDGQADGNTRRISAFGALEIFQTEKRKSDVYHQTDYDVTQEDSNC